MIYFENALHACMSKHFVKKVTKLSLFSLTFEANSEDIKETEVVNYNILQCTNKVIVCKYRLLKIVKNCLSKLGNSD